MRHEACQVGSLHTVEAEEANCKYVGNRSLTVLTESISTWSFKIPRLTQSVNLALKGENTTEYPYDNAIPILIQCYKSKKSHFTTLQQNEIRKQT